MFGYCGYIGGLRGIGVGLLGGLYSLVVMAGEEDHETLRKLWGVYKYYPWLMFDECRRIIGAPQNLPETLESPKISDKDKRDRKL